MNTYIKSNHMLPICGIAFIHWLITFFTDRMVFVVSPIENLSDYIICKLLLYIILFFFYRTLYRVIFSRERKSFSEYSILKYSLLFLLPILLILVIKLPQGFLSNDENLIFESAIHLQHDTWFYYITTYYYIISLMLIPFWLGPIIVKVIIQLLIVGYIVYRLTRLLGFKYGRYGYLLFLLYPVIAYTTSAHRLPIYYLLYLVLISMLLFDLLEKKSLTKKHAFTLLALGAVLTQWRTEGIYLAALVPILLFITYSNIRTKKSVASIILLSLILQYLISVPQNGIIAKEMSAAADDRMKPFYAYTITNMCRNRLDRQKNEDDLNIVDQYLSLEVIDSINEYYGEINYEDVLILYKEGFIGTRSEATVTDFFNYAHAVKRICLNNMDVFFQTRWGAFCYAAQPYKIVFDGFGMKQLISFGLSLVKTIAYNLFIPCVVVLLLFFYSLFRKRLFTFFATGGIIVHWFIVFILAPASYFKYYFPVYIIAYFYVLLFILQAVYNRKHTQEPIQFIR